MTPGLPAPIIQQGDIYRVDIPQSQTVGSEQWKRRPYIIVSRTAINRLGRNVVGVPMSTKLHKASQHRILLPVVEIIRDVGYPTPFQDSVALTDQIRVLDVSRLEVRMGKIPQSSPLASGSAFSSISSSPFKLSPYRRSRYFSSFHRICRSMPSSTGASRATMPSRRTRRRTFSSVDTPVTGFM